MLSVCSMIIAAVPFTRRPTMGHAGPQKTLFSIRSALGALRIIAGPGPREKAVALASLLRAMGTDYGLRFAGDLEAHAGDWD